MNQEHETLSIRLEKEQKNSEMLREYFHSALQQMNQKLEN